MILLLISLVGGVFTSICALKGKDEHNIFVVRGAKFCQKKKTDCKQQIINESPTQSRAGDMSVSMVDVVHTPEVM